MSKKIKDMTDEELVTFLKKGAKVLKSSAQTMEINYEKGMQSIIEFFKER